MKTIYLMILGVMSAASSGTLAQYASLQEQGINIGQNYIHSPVDSVNTSNGNLVLHIPLLSYKQLGTLPDFTLSLGYNAKSWQQVIYPTYDVPIQICEADPEDYKTPCFYYAWVYNGTGVQIIRGNTLTVGDISYPDPWDSDSTNPTDFYVFEVTDSSGSSSILYGTPGAPLNDWSPIIRTLDGTGIKCGPGPGGCIDSHGIFHSTPSTSYSDSWTIGFGDALSDPSGNQVTSVGNLYGSYLGWIDSVGRRIPAPNDWPNLSAGCTSYQFPAQGGGSAPYGFCYKEYTIVSDFKMQDVSEGTYTLPMLSSVTLPNGTSYQFSYNSWGDLSEVGMPDGGTISYKWTTIVGPPLPVACISSCDTYERAIQSRTLDANDGSPAQVWIYNISGNGGSVLDPMGNETDYIGGGWGTNGTTQEVHYQGSSSSGQLLSSVNRCRSFQDKYFAVYPYAYPFVTSSTISCGITTTLSDGSASKVSQTFDSPSTYGDPLNQQGNGTASMSMGIPLSTTVSNYGNGTAGQTLTTTTTQYEWQGNASYLAENLLSIPCVVTVYGSGSTPAESGCTPPVSQPNQLSQTIHLYDENNGSPQGYFGNETSLKRWIGSGGGYVNTSSVYNNYGMPTDRYDANWNVNVANRPGNHIHMIYDSSGLFPSSIQQSTTDGVSHVDYYAYDLNSGNIMWHTDQNGVSAQANGHTTSYSYDIVGRITSASYPDGGSSTYCYSDLGGPDCSAQAAPYSLYSERALSPDQAMINITTYNGFSQAIKVLAPNNAIINTTYDLLGRVGTETNVYYSTSDTTYGVTTTSYDALNRPLTVTNPDGSTRSWSYSGPTVTETDEDGNSWTRTSDALGRLIEVVEPGGLQTGYMYDALGNLLKVTQSGNGGSDTPRVRTFTYDSLSRLLCASNPENSTASCPTSATASFPAGVTVYSYDANGNMVSKTDTRGITTNYKYDALNRLLSKTYSNDKSCTPYSYYQYDSTSVSNGIGRLGASWTQAATGSNCKGSSSGYLTKRTILAYDPMGRVLHEQQATVASQASGKTYSPQYQYDLAGNLIYSTDGSTPSPTSPTSFPSCALNAPGWTTLTFASCFDAAGRLQNVASSWVDPAHPSNLFSTASGSSNSTFSSSSNAAYAAFGGLLHATYGTGITLDRAYDSRLRITGEKDTSAVSSTRPTPVTGSLPSFGFGSSAPATPASATVVITGTEQTK